MISEIEIRLRADIARLQQDMDGARKAVGSGLDRIDAAVGKTVGLLSGLAIGAGAVNFARFIKGSIDAADALNDLSDRTSVAIEDLAGLDFAARMTGTTLDGVAGAVSKLSMNIGKDADKFRELGVTATEPLEALKQLADIFKTIQDPQQRAAFGAAALGKQWAEVAPLLNEGSAGIDKLVGRGKELSGVTEQVARDAAAFNDKLDELTFAAQGAGTRIAADLLPVLNKIVEGFNASSTAAEKATDDVSLLSIALQDVAVVGKAVYLVIERTGAVLGAAVGQVKAFGDGVFDLLALDWKGFISNMKSIPGIGRAFLDDTGNAVEAFAQWETGIRNAGKAVKDVKGDLGIDKFMEDVDKAVAAGAKAAEVAAFIKAEEVAAAKKKAADEIQKAAEKEADAYRDAIAAINEKIAANKAEMASTTPLLESQKMRIKLDQDLKSGKLALIPAHEKEVRAALASLESQERMQLALKATAQAQAELARERDTAVRSATQEAEAQERLVAEFGLTKLAIEKTTLARMEEELAQRASLGLTLDEIAQLEKLIAAKKRAVAAGSQLEVLEQQKRATEEATKAQQDMWASIDRTAHDTFVSILEGNKNFAERLKATLKNTFFDWLYQMTVKKWILDIGIAGTGGGVAGLAQAATGANAAGGLGGVLGMLGGIGSGASQTAGALLAGDIGFGATASAGWSALTSGSMSGFSAGASSLLGVAAPVVAAIALGKQLNKAISGGFSTGGLSKITDNIGIVGGVLNRAFGRGPKELRATTLTGQFGADDFSGGNVRQEFFQKGGLFRSNKTSFTNTALATEIESALDTGYAAIKASTVEFAKALGLPTEAITGFTKSISVALTGDAAQDQAIYAKLLTDVGDELATKLVPNIAALATESETASEALARVSTNYIALDEVLKSIGATFGAVGVDSVAARERLIALSGGIEQLATNVAGFAQNFLTEAERLAPVAADLKKALADMGLGWVDTREEFKQVVLATDKTTEAGAKQFAALMSLQAAFAALYPSTEDLNRALEEQRLAQEAAAAAAAKAMADATAAAAKAAKDLRDSLVDGLKDAVSESLDNVSNLIDKQKAQEKAAFDEVAAGIGVAVDGANAKIAKLRDLSGVLGGFNATAGQTGQQAAAARQVGAAQIAGALAIARASGVLPTADSLKFAISALNQDTSGSFATSEDYQRSQLRAANDINALSKLADDQLSTEERTLKVLSDQKAAAESAYAAQIKVLDALLETARQQAETAVSGRDIANSQVSTLSGINVALAELSRVIAGLKFVAPPATGTAPGSTPPGSGTATPGGTLDQVRAVEQIYKDLLGRATDAAGLAFYTEALKSGLTLEQIRQDIMSSPEYLAQQAASQTTSFAAGAQAGTMSQDTSAALLAELQALNAQVSTLQTAMDQTAANTGASANSGAQLAQQFDQVTAGGNALLTEPVN